MRGSLTHSKTGWERARTSGTTRRIVSLAGEGLAITVAGQALADELLRPFSHLPEAERTTIEINAWDATACSSPVPELPWDVQGDAGAEIRIRVGEEVLAGYNAAGGSVTAVNPQARRGYYAVESADRLEGVERAVPLLTALRALIGGPHRAIGHGAVVARAGRGVLIPAMAGSGKSTLATAAILAGFDLVGDDITVITTPEGNPIRSHGLYNTVKLDEATLARFPGLEDRVVGRADTGLRGPKFVINLEGAGPGAFVHQAELNAIVVPEIGSEQPELAPVRKAAALLALAPTSVMLFGAAKEATGMAVMSEAVRRLPTYRLRLGKDFAANVDALRTLIEASDE